MADEGCCGTDALAGDAMADTPLAQPSAQVVEAESEFADVPPEEMTAAQYQELAARYNCGPYWQSDDAQAHGRGFSNNLDEARNALR
jgi:hypothetical protein